MGDTISEIRDPSTLDDVIHVDVTTLSPRLSDLAEEVEVHQRREQRLGVKFFILENKFRKFFIVDNFTRL